MNFLNSFSTPKALPGCICCCHGGCSQTTQSSAYDDGVTDGRFDGI